MPVGRLENLVSRVPVLSRLTGRLDELRSKMDRPQPAPEAGLSTIARAVKQDRLTYLQDEKLIRIESTVSDVLARSVQGDIVEFGIALGGSGIVLASLASGAERVFHGFDVFGMIPAPASDKDDQMSRDRYAVIASGRSEGINGQTYYGYRADLYGDVCDAFQRHGFPVDGRSVVLHKGLFEDTLPHFRSERIAFAHIDCDWYDPVSLCLNGIADRLQVGGAIVLDDYNDYGGCRTATHEFLAERHDYDFENGRNAILRRVR